jgi:hypothetical protein
MLLTADQAVVVQRLMVPGIAWIAPNATVKGVGPVGWNQAVLALLVDGG